MTFMSALFMGGRLGSLSELPFVLPASLPPPAGLLPLECELLGGGEADLLVFFAGGLEGAAARFAGFFGAAEPPPLAVFPLLPVDGGLEVVGFDGAAAALAGLVGLLDLVDLDGAAAALLAFFVADFVGAALAALDAFEGFGVEAFHDFEEEEALAAFFFFGEAGASAFGLEGAGGGGDGGGGAAAGTAIMFGATKGREVWLRSGRVLRMMWLMMLMLLGRLLQLQFGQGHLCLSAGSRFMT